MGNIFLITEYYFFSNIENLHQKLQKLLQVLEIKYTHLFYKFNFFVKGEMLIWEINFLITEYYFFSNIENPYKNKEINIGSPNKK